MNVTEAKWRLRAEVSLFVDTNRKQILAAAKAKAAAEARMEDSELQEADHLRLDNALRDEQDWLMERSAPR